MVFDENLKMTNNTEYSLTNTQIIQTENLLWSICVPILNERNKVISILAFDSDRSLLDIKNNRQELIRITNTLAVMMRDSAPDLFRTEWKVK